MDVGGMMKVGWMCWLDEVDVEWLADDGWMFYKGWIDV